MNRSQVTGTLMSDKLTISVFYSLSLCEIFTVSNIIASCSTSQSLRVKCHGRVVVLNAIRCC